MGDAPRSVRVAIAESAAGFVVPCPTTHPEHGGPVRALTSTLVPGSNRLGQLGPRETQPDARQQCEERPMARFLNHCQVETKQTVGAPSHLRRSHPPRWRLLL